MCCWFKLPQVELTPCAYRCHMVLQVVAKNNLTDLSEIGADCKKVNISQRDSEQKKIQCV